MPLRGFPEIRQIPVMPVCPLPEKRYTIPGRAALPDCEFPESGRCFPYWVQRIRRKAVTKSQIHRFRMHACFRFRAQLQRLPRGHHHHHHPCTAVHVPLLLNLALQWIDRHGCIGATNSLTLVVGDDAESSLPTCGKRLAAKWPSKQHAHTTIQHIIHPHTPETIVRQHLHHHVHTETP